VNEGKGRKVGNMAASLVLAVVVALVFYLGATQVGGSEGVDLIGGTVYSLVLSLIVFLVLVPRIVSRLSSRSKTNPSTTGQH
jgi:hypothetical protein